MHDTELGLTKGTLATLSARTTKRLLLGGRFLTELRFCAGKWRTAASDARTQARKNLSRVELRVFSAGSGIDLR